MFKNQLKKNLEAIFGFRKTTYDAPSDKCEQDTLFIEINQCRTNAGEGRATAEVSGTLTVFSKAEALPFGFFNKKIATAKPEFSKDIFFFEIDTDVATSPARLINLTERRTSFVYFYKKQFDPNQGELNELEFEGESA